MRTSTTLAAALLALAAAACGSKKDTCDTLYEHESKCHPDDKDVSRAVFVAACRGAQQEPDGKTEIADALECAAKGDCEAAKTCQQAKRGKQHAGDISSQLAAGKVKDAFTDCAMNPSYYGDATYTAACTAVFAALGKLTSEEASDALITCDVGDDVRKAVPAFAKACTDIVSGALRAATAAGTKARDAGAGDFTLCLDLKRLAEPIGGDTLAQAELLCKELDVTSAAKKAVTDARANVAASKAELPFECGQAAEGLAPLTSDWAKTTRTEVLQACYVELGAVLVKVKGADAQYGCPYELDQLKTAAVTHKLAEQFPAYAAVAAALPATCTK